MQKQSASVASALLPTTSVFMTFMYIMPACVSLHPQNCTFAASCPFKHNTVQLPADGDGWR